jgi:hypothetical protein
VLLPKTISLSMHWNSQTSPIGCPCPPITAGAITQSLLHKTHHLYPSRPPRHNFEPTTAPVRRCSMLQRLLTATISTLSCCFVPCMLPYYTRPKHGRRKSHWQHRAHFLESRTISQPTHPHVASTSIATFMINRVVLHVPLGTTSSLKPHAHRA